MPTTHRVPSTGLELSVREHGADVPGEPTVVLVHGYPDQQDMWDPVVAELVEAGLHVVTYDVRGAGESGVPDRATGYRAELLVDDLVAVLDATLPAGEQAHLVGHDWGSVQLWEAVLAEPTDPRLRGRIASFTSISGPSLVHSAWVVRHPRGRGAALLRQATRSWYVYAFQLPVLPELAWRGAGGLLRRAAAGGADHFGPRLTDNAVNGVNLYRSNIPRRMVDATQVHTDVPVLVVHPTRDRFLTGVLDEDLERICSDVRTVEVDGGHWVPRTHPEQIAGLVVDHIHRVTPA
jgi:pimeloyl-ACP methyl ester carboxylesterase